MRKFQQYTGRKQVRAYDSHRGKFIPMACIGSNSIFADMYERKILPHLNCGLDLVGEVLYGKWKIRILWFISEGHKRPSELQRKIPDVSRRVLTSQLKELEEHELVTRKIYAVLPPKVEYELTDFGRTLLPVIRTIGLWGDEHQERLKTLLLKQFPHSV